MRLAALTVRNFRAYCDETRLELDDFTALIGKNDVGKSTLLEALEIFFNNKLATADSADCHMESEDRTYTIGCEFEGPFPQFTLDASAETDLAEEHLLNGAGRLRIEKSYDTQKAKVEAKTCIVANHPSNPAVANLLELTQEKLREAVKKLPDPSIVDKNRNAAMRQALRDAAGDLALVERKIETGKGFGKDLLGKIEPHLPVFALFQSDRPNTDADAQVQDPMGLAVKEALGQPEVLALLCEVHDAVKAKATEIAARTKEHLARLNPGLASEMKPEFKGSPDLAKVYKLTLEGSDGIPMNKRGSGVRRLVILAFLQAEAERRRGESGRSVIYAVEEPETSQHPDHQRELLQALVSLSTDVGCQVLLTTHSPNLARELPAESIRFVELEPATNRPAVSSGEAVWPRVIGALGIFADHDVRAIVCVEGPTDVVALRALSALWHAEDAPLPNLAEDARFAFVPLGGSTIGQWVEQRNLRGLARPEFHLYDGDVAKYAEHCDTVNARGDGSVALRTSKWYLESYLHSSAFTAALRRNIEPSDGDDYLQAYCRSQKELPTTEQDQPCWNKETLKKKIAGGVWSHMTLAMLRERDPEGEVVGWLVQLRGLTTDVPARAVSLR